MTMSRIGISLLFITAGVAVLVNSLSFHHDDHHPVVVANNDNNRRRRTKATTASALFLAAGGPPPGTPGGVGGPPITAGSMTGGGGPPLPAGTTGGGPPPGTPGGPGGPPLPTSGGGGGPPPATAGSTAGVASQNWKGKISDAATSALFSLLHFNDETGIQDASKNLRVLWARALLNSSGQLQDDVAMKLLPSATRGVVGKQAAQFLKPIVEKLEFIQARTQFIDSAVNSFLDSPSCNQNDGGKPSDCQIVLFGAGYDSRAMRYRHSHDGLAQFIEVDLPNVVAGKRRLYDKFVRENDPTWNYEKNGSNLVAFDLNDLGNEKDTSLIDVLREKGGFRMDIPTLFVFEAVLYYVEEQAVINMMDEITTFMRSYTSRSGGAESLLCMTDSLKPFVRGPVTALADKWFTENGLDLLDHRPRWGGAIHFALASSSLDGNNNASGPSSERKHGVLGTYVASKVPPPPSHPSRQPQMQGGGEGGGRPQ